MSEQLLDTGMTEAENQFFESGGETELPELETNETETQEEEVKSEEVSAEVKEEPKDTQEQNQAQQEKVVPLAALHEERARRREMKQQMEAMEARLQQILSKMDSKNEQPAPDFEEAPLDALKHQTELIQKQLQQQNEALTQQQQAKQAEEYQNRLIEHYRTDAARFTQNNPDFMEAYSYMYNSRVNELQAYGYPQEQIAQIMKNEELSLVHQATQNEMSPAEVIYNVARARGYTAKQAQEIAKSAESTQKSEVENKFDMVAKGQEASKSLSNSGGKSEKDISLEALAEMDDEEFDKAWDKLIGG